jgi:peptide-methionine (S)-S-oxide reductase
MTTRRDVKVMAVGAGLLALIAVVISVSAGPRGRGGETPTDRGTGKDESRMEKAVFGAGCFWGVEETFRKVKGVTATRVGYMGGSVENPTYRQVCSDTTGHTEVCEVTFDPGVISYGKLLEVFWKVHDPTQVNRQGPDVGKQYRSVIFYSSEEQKAAAEKSRKELAASDRYEKPVATAIEPAKTFWPAEDYHQRYFEKRGGGGCHLPGK